MKLTATIVGLMAVAVFVLSYQLKTRRSIIIFNAGLRVLYVAQYILLGAFGGAPLDLVALLVSIVCKKVRKIFKNLLTNQIECGTILYVEKNSPSADLAHLVERDLAKVEVAGSSPVIRSIFLEA